MRIVPSTLVLACLLASLNGCQMFNKKSTNGDGPFLGSKDTEKSTSLPTSDPLAGGAGGATDLDGLLAGRVIDGAGQPADAQIRWVCMDDAKPDATPFDVAVNSQGYFMIQGLKSGKRYKLTTRSKSGDKALEVTTLAQAPNVHLLIQVNEKFAVPFSPDKGKISPDANKKAAASPAETPASAQIPLPNPSWQQPGPPMLPGTDSYGDKSHIADQPGIAIKPPVASWPTPSVVRGVPESSPLRVAPGPALVPSSVLVGRRLENFALYDTNLQSWEMVKNRTGKLLLLDFWKTNCAPCWRTIPTLRILTDQFGPLGLEVVGIAYEDTGTKFEQARRVDAVGQQRQANYQLLLGGGSRCPLKRDLQIRGYPTLVLLDETGVVIWRYDGEMDRAAVNDLTFAIRRRLEPVNNPY